MSAPSISVPWGHDQFNQAATNTTYTIGDLSRTYGFPMGVNELASLKVNSAPMFRLLSTTRRVPTDQTVWTYVEKRPFLYKRYGYATAWRTWSGSGDVPTASYSATADISTATPQTAGSYIALKIGTDYKSAGNIQNIYGQSATEVTIGDAGTTPIFFLAGQLVKVPTKDSATATTVDDFFIGRVLDVQTSGYYAYVGLEVIRPIATAANKYLTSFTAASTPISETYTYANDISYSSKAVLEGMKTTIVGGAFAQGSGMPDNYKSDLYSNGFGYTHIHKTTWSMENSAMATAFRWESDEFKRNWYEKLVEHKEDLNNIMYFSTFYKDSAGIQYTQGIVPYVLSYGNVFSLAYTESVDDFMDQLSIITKNGQADVNKMVFACDTTTYHWLNKLGGYAKNNMTLGTHATDNDTSFYRYNFDNGTPGRLLGGTNGAVDIMSFNTIYGPMIAMHDRSLNGTNVHMIGVTPENIKIRPLIGNGINRDTTIYPGVQKLENTGVDATTNLVQTEFGVEITLPETHVVWKAA